jgi:hypothetical protein
MGGSHPRPGALADPPGAAVAATCRRKPTVSLLAFAAAALIALAPPPATATVVVRSDLEPQVIGLGETATFTLEVQSSGVSSVRFSPTFTLENLEAVAGPSQSEEVAIINGALTRAYRLSWLVRPRAAGPARVRGITLKLLDRVVTLRDREIQVQPQPPGALPPGSVPLGPPTPAQPGGASPSPWGGLNGSDGLPDAEEILRQFLGGGASREPRSAAPTVFLRHELQPAQPLVGQQALYTLYLYTRQNIAAVSERDLPTFRGFWVREIALPEHLPSEILMVDGVRYTRVPLRRKALFALRPGRHLLEPASADVVVETYDPGFFAPPVPRSEEVHLVTPECVVEVQALPPAPPGFGGTVGQLRLAARVAPGSLRVGGAATVTIRLSGAGNLQGVTAPRLDAPAALTVSPAEQHGQDQVSGNTVQGERSWTYVVVPHSPGRFPLRVSAVPYFDPVQREYRLAVVPPLAVTTLPAAPGADPQRPAVERPPAQEDAGSQATRGNLNRAWSPWESLRQGWAGTTWPSRVAWGLTLGCGLVLLTILARRRGPLAAPAAGAAAADLQAPPATGRAHLLGGGARQLERRLAEAAVASRPRRVAAEVEAGWREFLAGRGELPPGTPAARWSALLRGRQWPPEAADELARLAEDIAYLRQAPQLSTTDELRSEIVARSRRLLRRLQ